MEQFLRNITDGSLRCRFCGDKVCNCMEEGFTDVEIISIWIKEKGYYVQLRKQTLPNGKKIPAKSFVWLWSQDVSKLDDVLKKIRVNNFVINTWSFNP